MVYSGGEVDGGHVWVEDFGDSKVEKFWGSVGGHDDVLWLEVSVDNEVGVCELNGLAYFIEEF